MRNLKETKRVCTIINYPDDGNHQNCFIDMPFFQIRKGEDGYAYNTKKGVGKHYNLHPNPKRGEWKPTKMWIVNLHSNSSDNLERIFEIKTSKSEDILIDYCQKVYVKYLKAEIKEMQEELKDLQI